MFAGRGSRISALLSILSIATSLGAGKAAADTGSTSGLRVLSSANQTHFDYRPLSDTRDHFVARHNIFAASNDEGEVNHHYNISNDVNPGDVPVISSSPISEEAKSNEGTVTSSDETAASLVPTAFPSATPTASIGIGAHMTYSASSSPPSSLHPTVKESLTADLLIARYRQDQKETKAFFNSRQGIDNPSSTNSTPRERPSPSEKVHMTPVLLTGFASAILFCAVFLACANRRDHKLHRKWETERKARAALVRQDDSSSGASGDPSLGQAYCEPFGVYDEEEQRSIEHARAYARSSASASASRTSASTLSREDAVQAGSSAGAKARGDEAESASALFAQALTRELAVTKAEELSKEEVRGNYPPNMLPPIGGDEEEDASVGLSLVSSLSQSLMGGSYYTSSDIELDPFGPSRPNEERSPSVCSSLTDGTTITKPSAVDCGAMPLANKTGGLDPIDLEGVTRRVFASKSVPKAKRMAADISFSTQSMTEISTSSASEIKGKCPIEAERAKLELLISGIKPNDDFSTSLYSDTLLSQLSASVREILVIKGENDISGLLFDIEPSEDATPFVAEIDPRSIFSGKLREGDRIMSINDVDVRGLSSKALRNRIVNCLKDSSDTIKITVASTGSGDSSLSGETLDFGIIEGRQEI